MAADLSSLSSLAGRSHGLMQVLTDFLQSWHQTCSHSLAVLSSNQRVPFSPGPPFPAALIYSPWALDAA